MKKALLILLLALGLSGTAAAGWWPFGNSQRPLPKGMENTMLATPLALPEFVLTDQDDMPFNKTSLKGKWSFLFFGYTHCPDVCPTTLATLRQVAIRLDKTGRYPRTQFVFISVDPKRDSPTHLKQYVHYFYPSFLAATGARNQIDALVHKVGAVYVFEGDTSGNNYIVNHSAAIYLIDPQGSLVARLNTPHTVDGLVSAYERIRKFYAE